MLEQIFLTEEFQIIYANNPPQEMGPTVSNPSTLPLIECVLDLVASY